MGGQAIAAGQRVGLLYGSANYDETVFDEPNRFDIFRDPNPHVGSAGRRALLSGSHLAKLEIDLMFNAIADNIPTSRPPAPAPAPLGLAERDQGDAGCLSLARAGDRPRPDDTAAERPDDTAAERPDDTVAKRPDDTVASDPDDTGSRPRSCSSAGRRPALRGRRAVAVVARRGRGGDPSDGFELGPWLRAFLVLVGGVAQIALGAGQVGGRPGSRLGDRTLELAVWNVGLAATMAGSLLPAPLLTALGAVAVLIALALFLSARPHHDAAGAVAPDGPDSLSARHRGGAHQHADRPGLSWTRHG